MPQNFVFGLAGEEDLNIGNGTFSVTLPDGSVVPTYHKIGSQTLFDGVLNTIQNGCVGDGIANDRAALNTLANTTLQPNGGTIFFAAPYTYRISSDLTIPSNVGLWLPPGSKISVDSGKTITINGPISAGIYQIFSGSGSVVLSASSATSMPVQWWGATADGVTDDTVAIQSTLDTAAMSEIPVFLPSGIYKITSALRVTAPIKLYGVGAHQSVIHPASGIDGIAINVPFLSNGPVFENFGILYPIQSVSGAGISVDATAGRVSYAYFRNLSISNAFNGIHFIKADGFVVDSCKVIDSVQAGIFVENQGQPDGGDSTIANCLIYNPFVITGATNGIVWRSSGGLRIANNKINSVQTGINIQLENGADTGDILITGNSLESVGLVNPLDGISVLRLGATGTLHSVLITGNQFNGYLCGVQVALDAVGPWLTNLSILGNTIFAEGTVGAPTGVQINSVSNFLVANNILRQSGTGGAGAFILGATADNGVLGPNIKKGTWGANSILSTNTTVIAPN